MDSTTREDSLIDILSHARKEGLVGVRIVREGNGYMLGVSWKTEDLLRYKNFHDLPVSIITSSYFPLIAELHPEWAQKLKMWQKSPKSILSIGGLR